MTWDKHGGEMGANQLQQLRDDFIKMRNEDGEGYALYNTLLRAHEMGFNDCMMASRREPVTLKTARKYANLTVKEAAKAAGVDVRSLKRWERGDVAPTVEHFTALCNVYGCSVNDIAL